MSIPVPPPLPPRPSRPPLMESILEARRSLRPIPAAAPPPLSSNAFVRKIGFGPIKVKPPPRRAKLVAPPLPRKKAAAPPRKKATVVKVKVKGHVRTVKTTRPAKKYLLVHNVGIIGRRHRVKETKVVNHYRAPNSRQHLLAIAASRGQKTYKGGTIKQNIRGNFYLRKPKRK